MAAGDFEANPQANDQGGITQQCRFFPHGEGLVSDFRQSWQAQTSRATSVRPLTNGEPKTVPESHVNGARPADYLIDPKPLTCSNPPRFVSGHFHSCLRPERLFRPASA